jgi:sirohydrochlorin ferrochelatase
MTQIAAMPYFLSKGVHVAKDVFAELAKAIVLHPKLEIFLCSHIGALNPMPVILLATAIEAPQNPLTEEITGLK